jgi:NADH:ubiquinone oxidoreductase subunit 6 (subunit J)
MTTAVFFVYAAVALGAGVVVVAARSAAVAVRALAVGLLAGCCAYVQMLAPVVAAVQLVMLAGATVAALQLAVGDEVVVPRRWLSALALVPIAGLVVLLVGTWARQFVWAGRELAAGSGFGGAAAVGQAWSEAHAPALLAALLALLVAAIAGSADRLPR